MKLIPLLFFFTTSFFFAQVDSVQYSPTDFEELEVYLKKINRNQLDKVEGHFASKIKKIFKDRDEKVLESVKDSNYIFNQTIKTNLEEVLNNIYSVNPEIDTTDYRFFIKNSIAPNAACFGDGMFEVNLGLFTSLDSDDELAFVVCHEIAHKILEHSMKGVTEAISKINSKETKQKVRSIKRNKYGQTRAALSIIDELNLDILDYSKEVEAQADSLGYILFSKTKYNKTHAISLLKKLDFEDDMLLHHDIKIDSLFNFKTYPFKSFWLEESISIFDTDEKINEFELASDTVKTHPEVEFRVEKLMNDFHADSLTTKGVKKNLEVINSLAHIKSIRYTIDLNFLDLAIYQLVEKYTKGYIDSEYYYSTMASVLKKIYEAKKSHELGKYVPQKNSFSDEKHLNNLRLFLHNLELNEIKKIGLAFCESNRHQIKESKVLEEVYQFLNKQ